MSVGHGRGIVSVKVTGLSNSPKLHIAFIVLRIFCIITNSQGLSLCATLAIIPCCNPCHLFLGTNADNMRDMAAKGRSTKGHEINQGANHGMAKLNESAVFDIRTQYAEKVATMVQLGQQYNVSATAISLIVNRHRWRHI